jgi:cell division protein FtsW (lipid II flippase)
VLLAGWLAGWLTGFWRQKLWRRRRLLRLLLLLLLLLLIPGPVSTNSKHKA